MTSKFKPITRIDARSCEVTRSVYVAEPLKEGAPTIYVRSCTRINGSAKELACAAIRVQLFVAKWRLINDLLKIVSAPEKPVQQYAIAVAHTSKGSSHVYPSGVVVVERATGKVSAFVRPKDRRKGVASALLEVLRYQNVQLNFANKGVKGSKNFWAQNSIKDVPVI